MHFTCQTPVNDVGNSPVRRLIAGLSTAACVGALLVAVPLAGVTATAAPVANPGVVSVGSGSYAAAPPAALDTPDRSISAIVDRQLYIDSSQNGKPVPTNSWWTDLIVSKYSGALWANPLVVSNSSAGTKIFYPNSWNADGSARVLDQDIEVQGTVTPVASTSDVVVGDFENGIPTGWVSTGNAFPTTSSGANTGQSAVSGFLGNGLINSFTSAGGDTATGTLKSPNFTINHNNIAFLIGGGNHPGVTALQLVVNGQIVRTATGANSSQLAWTTWDVANLQGSTAHLEIVDTLQGGWAHIMVDQIVRTNDVTNLESRFSPHFIATDAKALRWGEWNVSWRMASAGGPQHVDVTAARGIPYTYFEYTQMNPRIKVQPGATFAGLDGAALTFPAHTSALKITQGGRSFGVHLPNNSLVEKDGDALVITLTQPYMVISAIPATGASLADMQAHAFAVPRNTAMSYTYDPTAAEVRQTWNVSTDLLQGTDHATIQGWLPHHYLDAKQTLPFTGYGYDAAHGRLKMTVGTGGWNLNYPLTGITPVAPAPNDPAARAQIKEYLADYAPRTSYGGDTYWGGKDVLQLAEYMSMAKQVGADDSYDKLKSSLKVAMNDWLTYTPGETDHFFAKYSTWKGLVGFGESYGSAEFTDNHFHYGYFTLAAAYLAMEDPQWGAQYGDMATLVAQQYANWDRSSNDFPYLRTFDTWSGHSYAGGFSSPGGNNQESSSEAIQSWVGLFMLGTALGNDDMLATGAMGYVTERAAITEYWFNIQNAAGPASATRGSNFPASYDHGTTGILFDSGQAFATYFNGDPAWIYGIQWMPVGPWFGYFGWESGPGTELLAKLYDERPEVLGKSVGIDAGNDLGRVSKRWYGVGSDWGYPVSLDKAAAIDVFQIAVRNAYAANPTYVAAHVAANPMWDSAAGKLRFTVNTDGSLSFPAEYWTPATLPASLIPPAPPANNPDAVTSTWLGNWPAFKYLSGDYQVDQAALKKLYAHEVRNYTPGRDTDQAADVYSRMGDALGNVILGYMAEVAPDMYADIIAELERRGDPVATGISMAGAVYYNALANVELGHEVLNRHVAVPTSQVYKKGNTYTYVVYNPTNQQKSYPVYEGTTQIGSISVPAQTQIKTNLDASLHRIEISANPTSRTVPVGSNVQLTATGYDQYGATVPTTGLQWTTTTGGTINANGLFTGTANTESVTLTAKIGSISATKQLRVGPNAVLTGISVTPGFARVVQGEQATFKAVGVDQYGDPFPLTGAQWTAGNAGAISAAGVLTASTKGGATVTATLGQIRGSAVVTVVGAPSNLAAGKPVTASSGGATAAYAVDASATTRWESDYVDNQWIQVDLGATYELSAVDITWETAAAATYEVQVADSAAGPFRTLKSVTKADSTADSISVEGTGRYVRIAGKTRQTAYGFSIWNLAVKGYPGGALVTPTTVLVSPGAASVRPGGTINLTAYAFDAAGNGGVAAASWSVTGGGSVTAAGSYTAGSGTGTATVTASVGGKQGTATIVVGGTGTTDPGNPGGGDGTLVDLAHGRPATASSVQGAAAAALAVDGNAGTRWESQFSDGQWIQVDLGSSKTISEVQIDWEAAAAAQFTVQVSDSVTGPWQNLATVTKTTAAKDKVTVNGTARYVRISAPTRLTQYGVSMWELRILGPSDGVPPVDNPTDQARGKQVTASSGTASAAFAVDGDGGSRWESNFADGQWLQVDLGAATKLSEVQIDWETAAAAKFSVQVADSPTGPWRTLATVTKTTAGTDVVPVDGTGRYLRIDAPTRLTQWGVSIWSLRAMGVLS